MLTSRLLLPIGALACCITATVLARELTPFSCFGGSIYFSAHPVDLLLFQNPDLFHNLWVFKCVTAVILTTGDRGLAGNTSFSLEDGLGHAFLQMTGMPVYAKEQFPNTTDVRIGDHDIAVWTPRLIPDFHIIYLRLPDGGHAGQGYATHDGESLKKLWDGDIDNITTTNGNATYTLESFENLVATILNVRQPNDVRIMHHEAVLPEDESDDEAEHADHTISAKLVMDVIERENITANVHTYAGGVMRTFDATLKSTDQDFHRKAQAFLTYAKHDENMCDSIKACQSRLHNMGREETVDNDAKYAALYLEREYYVS